MFWRSSLSPDIELNLETMGAGTFALLTIAVLLLCSIVPIIVAYRSGTLTAADFALVLLPAPTFVFALLNFNEPARTGWAGILYPFLVLAVSVVALYARVFLLQRVDLPNRVLSIGTLIVVLMGAALLGAFVPPLYE